MSPKAKHRRRRTVLGTAVLLWLGVAVGCLRQFEPGELTIRPVTTNIETSPRTVRGYEEALAIFAIDAALDLAHDDDARALAHAVEFVINGDPRRAIGVLDTIEDARDPGVRARAHALVDKLRFGEGDYASMSESALEDPLIAGLAGAPTERFRHGPRPVTLPMQSSPTGVPMVEVEFSSGDHEMLWIDTGSGLSVIGASVAEEVGARPLPVRGGAVGTGTSQRQRAGLVIIPRMRIGDLVVENHPALRLEDESLSFSRPGSPDVVIPGIIGWPILARTRVEFDYERRTITLDDPARHEPAVDRNLFWFGFPVVLAHDVNGVPLNLGLDTGAHLSNLTDWGYSKLGLEADGHRKIGIWSAGREEILRTPVIRDYSVVIRDQAVQFDAIHVSDEPRLTVFALVDGILGSDVLSRGVAVVDPTNGRFELSPMSRG